MVKATYGKKKLIIPPHLAHSSWINYEAQAALSVMESLKDELKALKKKPDQRRVHKARVALRRWFSVWAVLKDDGWQSDDFKQRTIKPLRKLLKTLGRLRDCDVNLELVEELGVSAQFAGLSQAEARHLRKELRQSLADLNLDKIFRRAKSYLPERAETVERHCKPRQAKQTAFEHLDEHLREHEATVKQQSVHASTPDELHQLRLGVKRWRYLLTEFFGLTNLELVRAQQILGFIHDLDRLGQLLTASHHDAQALRNLRHRRQELLKQFQPMRTKLPYGLRPGITSLGMPVQDDAPEDKN